MVLPAKLLLSRNEANSLRLLVEFRVLHDAALNPLVIHQRELNRVWWGLTDALNPRRGYFNPNLNAPPHSKHNLQLYRFRELVAER